VIGLEVHCQLATRSKHFCGCRNEFGAAPNSLTCPVCAGAPGALPVLNGAALALAVRAALALSAEVAPRSRFERKNYFYCDLPKGYQISQFAEPLARGGGIQLERRLVRLRRLHVEEDAGKAIHDRGARTLVDLNRAGVPLVEIVSEPDLESPAEAQEYLEALREILRFAGVSECDMEKGSLRCDVNVSLHRPGEPLGTRTELKNLNSFRFVGAALEHELARQRAELAHGRPIRQETRLFDAATLETRPMRSKEDEDDYRYFPDPDLPPVVVTPELLERERAALPEPPAARRARWQREHGLTPEEAGVLSSSRAQADLFEQTARRSGAARESARWIANDLQAALAEREPDRRRLADTCLTAERLAELVQLVQRGAITRPAGRTLLRALLERNVSPAALVAELGLSQVSDPAEIEAWCRAALAGKERVIAAVLAGEEKALGALIGPVMRASGGRANPKLVQETLLRLVRAEHAR
jgi:aspartyl-tRNA(Asn)/glutamyl-tRNA(Gln) amidotransferase subunit B